MDAFTLVGMPLPDGSVTWFDLADLPIVMSRKWHRHDAYVRSNGRGEIAYLHRLIAKPETGKVVDHQNGDGMDNCRANLRICSQTENKRNNKGRNNSKSQFKGVTRNGHKSWQAYISKGNNSGRKYLGSFATEEEAARAYDKAAIAAYGEFARINLKEDACI